MNSDNKQQSAEAPGVTLRAVARVLSQHFDGARVRLEDLINGGPNSDLYRARISKAVPVGVAIKQCQVPRIRTPSKTAATAELDALGRVTIALAEQNCRYLRRLLRVRSRAILERLSPSCFRFKILQSSRRRSGSKRHFCKGYLKTGSNV